MHQSKVTIQNKSTDDPKSTSGANATCSMRSVPVLQKTANDEELLQKKPNNTGLPDNLKSGIENLSGYSMDDVKVHYNSSKPAQLQALAYAQGTDIHVAPGQERHLPHEAWHVVQQKQGRVQPTMQMKEGVAVNDGKGLENEADVMGGITQYGAIQRLKIPEKAKEQPANFWILANETYGANKEVTKNEVYNFLKVCAHSDLPVRVFTGTHGDTEHVLKCDSEHYDEDINSFKNICKGPNREEFKKTEIINMPSIKTKSEAKPQIDATDKISLMAWCFSNNNYNNWEKVTSNWGWMYKLSQFNLLS